MIASIAPTPEMRARVDFTRSLLPHAGAFRGAGAICRSMTRCPSGSKARRSRSLPAPRTRPISRPCSPRPRCAAYPSADVARLALRRGDVDLLFGDAHLARVLAQRHGFGGLLHLPRRAVHGQPLFRRRHWHRGASKGNDLVRLALNWALFRVWEQGRFTDLWLRYFPISPF